jgi:hypothetical protein
MTSIGASRRRLCVAADAVGYGRGDDYQQLATQRYLIEVLNSAGTAAGLHRLTWHCQPAGDAELAVLPEDEPESVVVDGFIRELDTALTRHNRPLRPEARLRLRVAVHFGRLMPGNNGFAGPGPVEVSRLLNSGPLRAAIAAAPEANLALLVSGSVYRDTIEPQHTTLRPADFRQVHVAEKEFEADAWLWVPGYDTARLPLPDGPVTSPEATVHTTVHGGVTGETVVFGVQKL